MKRNLLTFLLILVLSTIIFPQIGGYALNFDGTDDYVQITNSGTSVLGNNSDNSSFTIETWFKWGGGGWEIFTKHSGYSGNNNYGYFLEKNEFDKVKAGYGYNGGWVTVVGTPTLDYKWHHYAMVYNNAGTISLYIDGVLQGTSATFTPQHSQATVNLRLMSSEFYAVYTSGKLDEFRVWNTIRTEAEIKANMYKELAGNETGLLAYYKMSNGSGSVLTDNQTSGLYPGTINQASWSASGCSAGPRQALDFDGTDDYVAFSQANSPAYNNTALTIEAWIKSTSTRTEEEIVNFGNNTNQNVVEFRMSEGKLQFGMDVGAWYQVSSNSKVNDGNWNHVAVTKDGNNLKLYINGKLDAAGTITASPSVNRMTIANVFQNNTYHSSRYEFLGLIDEVRIWNSVRTEEQLRENMMINLSGNEAGLIAYYRFDHYDGTTLYDCSNNGKNGTLTNMDPATDWVASRAFTTWIGSENNSWYTGANWSQNIAPMSDNTGLYKWDGGYDLNISSPGLEGPGGITANNILFSVSSNPILYTNISVSGNLLLSKDLNLNGQTINLGSSGTLFEGNYRIYGTSGTITATRTLGTLGSITNVAGLGFSIKSTGDLGSTTITRGIQSQSGSYLTNGVNRYYDVTVAGGAPYDLVFNYLDTEVPGTESNLALFKSADGGSSWEKQTASFDANLNTFSLTGAGSMSRWTAADNNSPLPVELTSFTAKASANGVLLKWVTATEVNNYGFEVERSLKTESDMVGGSQNPEWDKIGFVAGSGNSNSVKEYSFTDYLNDASVQSHNHKIRYRLKQIDNDWKFSYSKEVEIENLRPAEFELHQNYPNPFNPGTTIRFGLPADTRVTLEVFNIIGEKVSTLVNNEMKSAGYYEIQFNGSDLSSGVYFFRLTAGEFTSTKKLNIIK